MLLLSLLLSLNASAQDCKAIPKALRGASPHEASRLYVELAGCDKAGAKKAAAATLEGKLIPAVHAMQRRLDAGGGTPAVAAAPKPTTASAEIDSDEELSDG